ncbi:MAG: methylated-DNA--[protein]-cysteine S-methyltransferase [Zoogloea sp.]|nr:methylated-DNA--[protein]-cysteine S-methyltransferase [Zoogloea sp.]MCA0184739.1 methylated-DNA--[protein]-cysteine S-methyltransferase [Pseudomonadota bacterium]
MPPQARHTTAKPPAGFAGIIPAPFGRIGIRCAAGLIEEIVFLAPDTPLIPPGGILAEMATGQIERYLADPGFSFSLPLALNGTAFRRQVWNAITQIPTGQSRTYGELARQLDSSPRAVGQACGDNPFPLAIPCHRVTGQNGIGGFAHDSGGFLLETKHWLLRHEGVLPPRLPGF